MKIEFCSGAEECFPSNTITLSYSDLLNLNIKKIKDLIIHLYKNNPNCRNKIFTEEGSLCPGILCCINESDWELFGEEEATIEDNTNVIFLSTIHGG